MLKAAGGAWEHLKTAGGRAAPAARKVGGASLLAAKKAGRLSRRGLRASWAGARRASSYTFLVLRENRTVVVFVLLAVLVFGGFLAYVLGLGLRGVKQPANGYGPATEWHFAAGSTANGHRTLLNVLNPSGDPAKVKVSYMYGASEVVEKDHEAPARSGYRIDCMQELGGLELEFGMKITSDKPVVVSREIFNTGAGWAASSVEQGIKAPSAEWAFAEGSTSDGRRTFLYLLNDGATAATVTIEGFKNDGERNAMTVGIDPRSSYFLDAARMFDNADNVSMAVSSDEPVFAERYYETVYRGLRVACCCPGARGTRRTDTVVLPADTQMGRVGILNPQPVKSTVRLTYYLQGGRVKRTEPIDVDGYCRKVVTFDDSRLGPGAGVVGQSGFTVGIRVLKGSPVAVESTAFGSGKDAWTWLAVSRGVRPADAGPVFIPVVNDPAYRECLVVGNQKPVAISAKLAPKSANGEGEKGRKVKLEGGETGYVYSSDPNSRMSWYEASLPGDTGWSLFSYRAFSCETVDRTAIAFSFGRRLQGVQTRDPALALTFNMEAEPDAAKAVLDALKESGVTATFFVSGEFAKENPGLVRRAAREGHELANLTYTHSSKSGQQLVKELVATESLVTKLTGKSTRPYARLPFGYMGYAGLTAANRAGYVEVTWNVDPRDWDKKLPPATIVANCMQDAKAGSIVLMTTIYAEQKRQALPAMIRAIRDQGLKMVPLTELLYFAQ